MNLYDLMGNNIKLWFTWYWLMIDFWGEANNVKNKIQQICKHDYLILESSKGDWVQQQNKYYWEIIHKRKCALCNYEEEGSDNQFYHKMVDMVDKNLNIITVEMLCADQFLDKLGNTLAEIKSVSLDDYCSFDPFKCRSYSDTFLKGKDFFWSHNRNELITESIKHNERKQKVDWALSISNTKKEFLKALNLILWK
jgi:hypothetical protein